jgi:hypothetical protein
MSMRTVRRTLLGVSVDPAADTLSLYRECPSACPSGDRDTTDAAIGGSKPKA